MARTRARTDSALSYGAAEPLRCYLHTVWSPDASLRDVPVEIDCDRRVLGREPASGECCVPGGRADIDLSARHAALLKIDGGFYIQDLDSSNGTCVNGHRLTRYERVALRDGDVVRAGATLYVARFGQPPGPAEGWDDPLLPGWSPLVREVRARLRLVAASDWAVLVFGETGVGKEWVARGLHDVGRSGRRASKFVAVNCPGISESLGSDDLFGHVKGAFSHASDKRAGLVQSAGDGTLCFDELQDMPASWQAGLLRFLEDGRYRQHGSDTELASGARVVGCTSSDARLGASACGVREELFARLCSTAPIRIPALRERAEDIPAWIARLRVPDARGERPCALSLDVGLLETLLLQAWPANLRELRRAINTAEIDARVARRAEVEGALPLTATDLARDRQDVRRQARQTPIDRARVDAPPVGLEPPDHLPPALRALYRQTVPPLLGSGGNITQEITRTGAHRQTLYRMLAKLELAPEAVRAPEHR